MLFQNVGRCPQLALVCFLSFQSTDGQSFTFPDKSELRNALLHSRSGCLHIETLSSVAFLPVTLNTVYDKSLLIPYRSHIRASVYKDPHAERDSTEPTDSRDCISDSENCPPQ